MGGGHWRSGKCTQLAIVAPSAAAAWRCEAVGLAGITGRAGRALCDVNQATARGKGAGGTRVRDGCALGAVAAGWTHAWLQHTDGIAHETRQARQT